MMIARRWVWIVSLLLSLTARAGDFQNWEQAAAEGKSWKVASARLSVEAVNEQGRTVAHVAARFGRIDWLEHLPVSYLVRADDMDNQPIHSAAWSGRINTVIWLHEHGSDLAATNRQGWQPLHMALFNGHNDLAVWLVAHHVPVNVATHDGWTPLGLAVAQGACDLVPLLRKAGADVHQTIRVYGRELTPVELAQIMQSPACITALQ